MLAHVSDNDLEFWEALKHPIHVEAQHVQRDPWFSLGYQSTIGGRTESFVLTYAEEVSAAS